MVADISLSLASEPDPLAEAIPLRCVNRKPFDSSPLPPTVIDLLNFETKKTSGVQAYWVQDSSRRKILASVVMESDRLLLENPHLHSQLFAALRWTKDEIEDAGRPSCLNSELGRISSKAFRALKSWPAVSFLNHFGLSRIAARRSHQLIIKSSRIGLIAVPALSPEAFLNAGRVLKGSGSAPPRKEFLCNP